MIGDPQRGSAWTRALLGLPAAELHLCGDGSALDLVRQICDDTGEELEVVDYSRKTPLVLESRALSSIQVPEFLSVFDRTSAQHLCTRLYSLTFSIGGRLRGGFQQGRYLQGQERDRIEIWFEGDRQPASCEVHLIASTLSVVTITS